MKTTIAAAFAAALCLAAPARAQHEHPAPARPVTKDAPAAPAAHANEHMSGWKALDDYHMVMMRAWHPAKETKNLAPARAAADSLVIRADQWAASPVPHACDSPATREAVAKVRTDTRAFAEIVRRGGNDADTFTALHALHEAFEGVNRGCRAH